MRQAAPSIFAARLRSGALTQRMAPYRFLPAETAVMAVTLIFASASLRRTLATAPMRSSPWMRKPLFFLLSVHPAFLAHFAKAAESAGMKSNWARRPLGNPEGQQVMPCFLDCGERARRLSRLVGGLDVEVIHTLDRFSHD